MQRRPFLRTLSAALLAPVAGAAACARAATSGTVAPGAGAVAVDPARRRLGIQLYTLRDAARKDLPRTLADIASVGFTDVELLGSMKNFDAPPKLLRDTLDSLGLRAPSTHVGADVLDTLPRALDEAATLGHEYLIIAGFPEAQRRTLDDWRRWAERLNEAGAIARGRGVWLGFHPHAGDLVPIAGQVPFDLLIERTDPAVTRHQLDIGNVAMGGRDPIEYVERYNARFWSFHVKDVPRLGADRDTELGAGALDIPRLLSRVERLGEKLLFVEQETYPGEPLESVRRDFAYMRRIGH